MTTIPSDPAGILAELVACPSVSPEGDAGGSIPGEVAMARLVAGILRKLGADVAVRPAAPGRPNVVAVFTPAGPVRSTVVLAPHLDTVGVAGMTVPPFELTRRGGRLHGRGACDTKGPMAALFAALRRWTRKPARSRGEGVRWIVAVTAGEEQGCVGARALLADRDFKADFAIALEPTDLRVVYATKGVLRTWITARGQAAHGSTPDRGVNAIYRLLPLALALRDEVAPALEKRRHPLLGSATLNVGVMTGGRDLNVVPDLCRLGLDIRLHPGCTVEEAMRLLEDARRRYAPEAEMKVLRSGPPMVTERTHPWARRLRSVGRGWATANWFCDANFFAASGIPAVAFGPGSIAQAHTKDEYITRRALADGADAFERLLGRGL